MDARVGRRPDVDERQDGLAAVAEVAAFGRAMLDLLHVEAAAIEFERPLLAARDAGLPDDLLVTLDASRQVALRIRGELAQRRRREAELAALFETASDLASLHRLDSVLRAIVRRARLLLGADVSYMTVPDPVAKDTYMRITSGSVSAEFQQVRLGLGEGLGGLVAQRGAPYATAGYLSDERFLHTVPIDRAVREEGLVAILGVPLLLGEAVIGVLFAADRRHRSFGPDEVSLLSSLAAHAAIAIDGANLLEETRTALAELNAANELVKEHSDAVERAAEAHHLFTELVLAGGGAEDVARAVSAVLGKDVSILSEQDSPIAASSASADARVLPDAATLSAVAEARAARRAVCAGGCWAVPATAGSEHLGTLVLRAGPDLHEDDRLILERAAMVCALLLLMRRSVTEAEHRLRGDLLSDLLSAPHRDAGSLRDRAKRLSVDLGDPHVVFVVHAAEALRPRLRSAGRTWPRRGTGSPRTSRARRSCCCLAKTRRPWVLRWRARLRRRSAGRSRSALPGADRRDRADHADRADRTGPGAQGVAGAAGAARTAGGLRRSRRRT